MADGGNPIHTEGGRSLLVVGNAALVSMDRMELISRHFDSEPRLASVSVVPSPTDHEGFLRATAPAGPVCVLATDLMDLVGQASDLTVDSAAVIAWAHDARDRGLWHDWLLTRIPDTADVTYTFAPDEVEDVERRDPSSSRHAVFLESVPPPPTITLTIDATWLGPHETGAQVLTTSAIEALARRPEIASITLTGIDFLPNYAVRLADLPNVRIDRDVPERSDIAWYPNQIDQRSNIGVARELGHRVVTTYLDLIAYDIPRYHGSSRDWWEYRSLQRNVALSVDGITTISADVAQRLLQEVPRLEPERVRPIPLGLDHISGQAAEIGDDIREVVANLGGKPFLLVLGNDFVHKNRDFAIRVWEKVLDSGLSCDLVLAGLHVRSSSSRASENELLALHTNLRGRVHILGHVSSSSRSWLLANASVVIYPSSAEGFGFVPYEAALFGTPATFTSFGPLKEISGLTSVPTRWSVDAYAADVSTLLSDSNAARQRVHDLAAALDRHTWDRFAAELASFFMTIRSLPTVSALAPGASVSRSQRAALGAPRRTSRRLRTLARRITRRGR